MSKNKDKIAGALYGFAIGDAMGATTEFMSKEEIAAKYGVVDDIIGGGWLGLRAGDVTDDTQMMICVMEALQDSIEVGNGTDYFHNLVGANFIEWFNREPKDVGNQCAAGIVHYQRYGYQRDAKPTECGNGGIMRALPCTLVGKLDLNLAQNSFTHHNDECMLYIRKYHNAISNCLQYDYPYIKLIKNANHYKPTGYVRDTFENAMWHSSHASNVADAIISAVNDGGDADTIGALTGGLAGAMFGYKDIPEKWIKKLNPEVRKYLDKFINFCCRLV